jgi:hypothetical protein
MHEDFVSFSIAKKLKEKGYPQAEKNALAMYNKDSEWYSLSPTLDDFYYDFRDFDENDCVSPTISQVLKWLRDEKKIHIEISPKWQYTVYDMRCNPWIGYSDMQNYDDYTMAVIAGIEYCLDNLI